MAKNSSKTINWICAGIAAYFIGTAIAGAVKRRKGIGKVERIKRRIYKEVSLAQDAGVDFSRKYDDLTPDMKDALNTLGHDLGWKQSKRAIESGKPYTESYYGSLRRAWNAVSGVQGIGRAYDVKDANGNTVLTWIEDAATHIQAETPAPVAPKAPRTRKPKPSAETTHKSKQQQILDKFPYLKIMDDPFNPISNSTAFSLVVWRTAKNQFGDILYEGPAMAFTNRAAAEDAISWMRGKMNFQTDVWHEYWNYLSEKFQKEDDEYYKAVREGKIEKDPLHVSKRDQFYGTRDTDSSLTIKDVNKINIDKISGIGYIEDDIYLYC